MSQQHFLHIRIPVSEIRNLKLHMQMGEDRPLVIVRRVSDQISAGLRITSDLDISKFEFNIDSEGLQELMEEVRA